MYKEFIVTTKGIEKLRQRARKLKKQNMLQHHEALDIVAKSAGFDHWHHVSASAKLFKESEQAYYFGCVIAMDAKNGFDADENSHFAYDHALAICCGEDIFNETLNSIDEHDPQRRLLKDTESLEESRSYHQQEMEGILFYRQHNSTQSKTLSEILKHVARESFWLPEYVWLNGEFYNTSNYPSVDENGNIVGVQW